MALIIGAVLGGVLITAGVTVAIWRGLLRPTNSAAAESVIGPSSRTVRVACRRRRRSTGRPTVRRADLLRNGRRPRLWDWTPCDMSSPVTSLPWNARQWYSPDTDMRLVLPAPSKSWDWKPCSSLSLVPAASRAQNWYSPGYHSGSSSPNSSLRRQQHYYSTRVTDPRVHRAIPPSFVADADFPWAVCECTLKNWAVKKKQI